MVPINNIFLPFNIELIIILSIFAVPAYFFWRWLFKKRINDPVKKQMFTIGAAALSSPIIYFVAVTGFLWVMFGYTETKFDQKAWADNPHERFKMAQQLIDSKTLLGKNKAQINELLGLNYFNYGSDQWQYGLGGKICPEVLTIAFKNGVATHVTKFAD